jgi:hypothetical protein
MDGMGNCGIQRVELDPHDGKLQRAGKSSLRAGRMARACAGKQTWRAISGMASGAGLLSMPSEVSGIPSLLI